MVLGATEVADDVHRLGGNPASGKDHANCENHFGDSSSNPQHSLKLWNWRNGCERNC